jgi:hypothetical protein
MGREALWIVPFEDATGEGLESGELGGTQVLRDVESAGVYKLLKAKAGWRLRDRPRLSEILLLGTNCHDTTLPGDTRLTFVYLLDAGKERKSLFWEEKVLPQRWYVVGGSFYAGCGNKGFIWITGLFGDWAPLASVRMEGS